MKGWYVIPTNDEPVEVKTKKEAVKIGKDYYLKGDLDVFIKPFNDNNDDGYFSNNKTIFISNLMN